MTQDCMPLNSGSAISVAKAAKRTKISTRAAEMMKTGGFHWIQSRFSVVGGAAAFSGFSLMARAP
jgi:hypothetical protein